MKIIKDYYNPIERLSQLWSEHQRDLLLFEQTTVHHNTTLNLKDFTKRKMRIHQ